MAAIVPTPPAPTVYSAVGKDGKTWSDSELRGLHMQWAVDGSAAFLAKISSLLELYGGELVRVLVDIDREPRAAPGERGEPALR